MTTRYPFGTRHPVNVRPDLAWGKETRGGPDTGAVVPTPTFRPLAGAPDNARGGGTVLSFAAGELPPPLQIASIVQAPKNSGQDAENIVVTLGFQPADQYANEDGSIPVDSPGLDGLYALNLNAVATLTWGVGGANFDAEVDWQNGVCFALSASSLNVGLRFDPFEIGYAFDPFKVRFDVGLGYGRAGRGARRTLRMGILAQAQTSEFYEIPPFANSMNLYSNLSTPSAQISFYGGGGLSGGALVARYTLTSSSNTSNCSEQQFPVPNEARLFKVTNLAVQEARIAAVFNLDLT